MEAISRPGTRAGRRPRGSVPACVFVALVMAVAAATASRPATAAPGGPAVGARIALRDTAHPVYIINDTVSQRDPFSMADIGLIDIVQPDSALAHYGTRNVIRVYTQAFILAPRDRFGGVPVIAPATLPDTGSGGHRMLP